MNIEFGISKIDVTPQSPCRMGGYNRKGAWTDVLDPIEVNASAVCVDLVPFILIELDSIMVSKDFSLSVKNAVSSKTGIDSSNIVVACIHTHSAPCYFKLAYEDTLPETELTSDLIGLATEAAVSAWASRSKATVSMEMLGIEGLYGNRNVQGGPADKQVSIFSFEDAQGGRPIGKMLFMSAHPTILNGKSAVLSADLIGHVRQRLERKYGCPVLCVNGTCGDVSTRFYRQGEGVAELERTANELCAQIESKRERAALRS